MNRMSELVPNTPATQCVERCAGGCALAEVLRELRVRIDLAGNTGLPQSAGDIALGRHLVESAVCQTAQESAGLVA